MVIPFIMWELLGIDEGPTQPLPSFRRFPGVHRSTRPAVLTVAWRGDIGLGLRVQEP